jgi:hypothetical protein
MFVAHLILAAALAAGTLQTVKAGNPIPPATTTSSAPIRAANAWPWSPAGGMKKPYAKPVKSFAIASRASQTRWSYDWPIKPFRRQHVVRAYLDDPRIPRDLSAHNFHIGIDIGCPAGTPVYAIEAGTARRSHGADASVVEVYSSDRSLSYWHIRPAVRDWQHVQRHTLVGWTLWNFNHVHLSERDGVGYVNPLRLGGLGPFVDHTIPKTIRVSFRAGAGRRNPLRLSGRFDIVADAVDLDPGVSPQPWAVTPSLLRWRIMRGGRVVVPWQTGPDFRTRVLTPDQFASVYAPGTRANHRGQPGYFSFYLAHGWRSTSLANGSYRLEVSASDIRGNMSLSLFAITIAN